MILTQAELIGPLLEQSAAQSFGTFVLAVMVGLLCLALGFVWRQYAKAIDIILSNQRHNDELVKLLNSKNYEATRELIVRIEAERRMNT